MKAAAGLLFTLTAVQAMAAAGMPATGTPAAAYVSDELVLGVYAEENGQGQRLATLHSGAALETLSVSGDFTQVRLSDGITGWVKSTYLTAKEPAVVRVKRLEEELERSHATTPALAEAAARSEVVQLRRELDEARSTAVQPSQTVAGGSDTPAAVAPQPVSAVSPWAAAGGMLAALAGGFCLGYATLARRVRSRFGGLKVY